MQNNPVKIKNVLGYSVFHGSGGTLLVADIIPRTASSL